MPACAGPASWPFSDRPRAKSGHSETFSFWSFPHIQNYPSSHDSVQYKSFHYPLLHAKPPKDPHSMYFQSGRRLLLSALWTRCPAMFLLFQQALLCRLLCCFGFLPGMLPLKKTPVSAKTLHIAADCPPGFLFHQSHKIARFPEAFL